MTMVYVVYVMCNVCLRVFQARIHTQYMFVYTHLYVRIRTRHTRVYVLQIVYMYIQNVRVYVCIR